MAYDKDRLLDENHVLHHEAIHLYSIICRVKGNRAFFHHPVTDQAVHAGWRPTQCPMCRAPIKAQE